MATSSIYRERVAAGICPQCGVKPPMSGRTRCQPCAERANALKRARTADPVKAEANRQRVRDWQERYPLLHLAKNARYRARLWQGALDAYGRSCACCGEAEEAFLTIDHIDGGGNQHRAETGAKGSDFYRWLQANDYPSGFQTLCWNCNCARGIRGGCPHQAKEAVA